MPSESSFDSFEVLYFSILTETLETCIYQNST